MIVLVALATAGCAPQSPDRSSWVDQGHKSLHDTASEVATVQLLLRLQDQGKVPGKYQQVVAQDSETAVAKTMDTFGGEQPPPGDDKTYTQVTTLMSDASDLLAKVRIAIVRRDEAAYPGLADDLTDIHRKLLQAAADLRAPTSPSPAGSGS